MLFKSSKTTWTMMLLSVSVSETSKESCTGPRISGSTLDVLFMLKEKMKASLGEMVWKLIKDGTSMVLEEAQMDLKSELIAKKIN